MPANNWSDGRIFGACLWILSDFLFLRRSHAAIMRRSREIASESTRDGMVTNGQKRQRDGNAASSKVPLLVDVEVEEMSRCEGVNEMQERLAVMHW